MKMSEAGKCTNGVTNRSASTFDTERKLSKSQKKRERKRKKKAEEAKDKEVRPEPEADSESKRGRYFQSPTDVKTSMKCTSSEKEDEQEKVLACCDMDKNTSVDGQGDSLVPQRDTTEAPSSSEDEFMDCEEFDIAAQQADTVTNQREMPTHQGDTTTHQGDTITHQGDTTTHQGDTTIQQGDTTQQGDPTTPKGDAGKETGDASSQERDTTQQGDITTQQGDTTTQQGDIATQKGDKEAQQKETELTKDASEPDHHHASDSPPTKKKKKKKKKKNKNHKEIETSEKITKSQTKDSISTVPTEAEYEKSIDKREDNENRRESLHKPKNAKNSSKTAAVQPAETEGATDRGSGYTDQALNVYDEKIQDNAGKPETVCRSNDDAREGKARKRDKAGKRAKDAESRERDCKRSSHMSRQVSSDVEQQITNRRPREEQRVEKRDERKRSNSDKRPGNQSNLRYGEHEDSYKGQKDNDGKRGAKADKHKRSNSAGKHGKSRYDEPQPAYKRQSDHQGKHAKWDKHNSSVKHHDEKQVAYDYKGNQDAKRNDHERSNSGVKPGKHEKSHPDGRKTERPHSGARQDSSAEMDENQDNYECQYKSAQQEWQKYGKQKKSGKKGDKRQGKKSSAEDFDFDPLQSQKFQIREIQGNLFSSPSTESLAHCVSEDFEMGKGIAKTFKDMFDGVRDLKAQGKQVGEVAVLEDEGRYIYYLITKERYFMKPTYKTLQSSLEDMKNHCQAHQVTNLSIPRLGCGLDQLSWGKVSRMLCDVFKDTRITITVYGLKSKAR